MKRRLLSIVLVLAMIASCFSSVTCTNVSAATKKKTVLSSKSVTMNVGQKKTLKLKNYAKISKPKIKKVKWTTSNKKIVSIKSVSGKYKTTCKIIAKKAGTSTIKLTYNGKTYKCKIIVKNKPIIDVNTETESTEQTTEDQKDPIINDPPIHNHNWNDGIITTPATCTTDGIKVKSCSCGETKTEIIPATGHINIELQNQKKADCGDGYTGDSVCKDCGVVISTGTIISGTGNHNWDNGTMNEDYNCADGGIKTYECTICHITKTEIVEVHAHSYTPYVIITEPTCTSTGLRHTECTECGHIKEVEIEKLSHSYIKTGTSIINDIQYDVYKCSICGYIYKEKCENTSNAWYLSTTNKGYSYTYTSSNRFIAKNEVNLYYKDKDNQLAVAFTITSDLEDVMDGVKKYTNNKSYSKIILVPIMSSKETIDGLNAKEVNYYIKNWIKETGLSKYSYDNIVYRSYNSDNSSIPYLEIIKK